MRKSSLPVVNVIRSFGMHSLGSLHSATVIIILCNILHAYVRFIRLNATQLLC